MYLKTEFWLPIEPNTWLEDWNFQPQHLTPLGKEEGLEGLIIVNS